jgi:polyhydroxyalkanoate synthesis repressor PhaR
MKQASKIIIKKYPNRRLYNTLSSSYIKLDDIVTMVRKDEDFAVIDVKTEEDITRIILAQIILDYESKGYELMPEKVIKTIIKFYGNPISTVMQDWMLQMIQVIQNNPLSTFNFAEHQNFHEQMKKFSQNMMTNFTAMIFGSKDK